VCWTIVVKEKPVDGSQFFETFRLTASLRRRRISMYVSLFTVTIPVNIITANFCKLYQRNPGNYLSYYLKCSRNCVAFKSSGIWRVFGWPVHDISKGRSASSRSSSSNLQKTLYFYISLNIRCDCSQ
jgi:hypothetical protein